MKRVREDRGARIGDGAPHIPVLLDEVLAALALPGAALAVDGTFGAGGYTRAMLAADPGLHVLGIDRDPNAIAGGAPLVASAQGRLTLVPGRFGALDEAVRATGHASADAVVLDIGVSSMQIDQPERGFSFRNDGPLDMRMERAGPSAADIVNESEEADLADIIFHYGEERRSRAVARAILEARRKGRIETTAALAEVVASVVWADPASGIHPATRTFQGLRIAVNDELGELVQALHAAERILKPGGRLAVVTFHSLEDRIVKQFFSARSGRAAQASRHVPSVEVPLPRSFRAVTRAPVLPSEAETHANPRARSAKLRAVERTDAPVPAPLAAIETLAALPVRSGSSRGSAPVIRLLNLVAVLGLIGSAIYAYSIKYDTLYQAGQVSKARTQLQKERQAIAVLRAEWQLLTRPDRLQAAVDKYLALEPIGTAHLGRLVDLPARPDRGDEIGRLLAATATPKEKPGPGRGLDEPRTTGSVPTRTTTTRTPTTASR